MSDILVTSPFHPFTLPNQFKAVFNGYIYCGTVDAVDPSVSQVQVYLVNEAGDKVPVAQPLRTNAGGYMVYNGQPAKFVTDSNHSLLVQDQQHGQVWYEPNMAVVDPNTAFTSIEPQVREALRRTYAEAGYNLVSGSFESGGIVSTANDVLLYEAEGFAYSWGGALPKSVPSGSTPSNSGGISPSTWTNRSGSTLRDSPALYDPADVRHHGGSVSAADNSQAILDAAAASPSGIIIRGGVYNTDSVTIDCPIEFEAGSGISANSGALVKIRNRVSAGIYQIFYGDGTFALQHITPYTPGASSSGEQARFVHVAWFGAFPNGNDGDDLAPAFQKIADSLDYTREAWIGFDIGTYTQRTGPVTWPRAAKMAGIGDRLTNIWVKFLAGDVWKTGGGGMNIEGFQFNCDDIRTSGCYVRFDHERCEAYDIYMDHGYRGIGLYGYECKTYRTKGLTWAQAAGSAVVDIGHDDCVVDDTDYTNTIPVGPEFVVRFNCDTRNVVRPEVRLVSCRTNQSAVGGNTGAFTVQEPTISKIKGNQGSHLVKMTVAGAASPNTIQISEVVAGPGCQGAVKIEATGGSIFGVVMDMISGNANTGNCIDIQNNGAGNIRPVILGQHDLRGVNGLFIGGSGNPPERVSLSGGAARNCTSRGYDLKCKYLTASALNGFSNATADMTLRAGSDVLRVIGNSLVVDDQSGAVNKVIQSNL